MPLFDLLKYQGRNPRPVDFDAFWDQSLHEMRGTSPSPQLTSRPIKADFAECFDLNFTGVGGSQIYAKYLRPKGKKNCPCILQFHGYSMFSGDWVNKLNYVAQGFAVVAMDCRGQGGEAQDSGSYAGSTLRGHIIRGLEGKPEDMYFRNVFLDCAMLARVVSDFDEIDANRLGATGGSQGGGLTLACAALSNIKKAAAFYPFLSDYKRVWEMDLAKDAYDELKYFFRMRDPRHEREDAIFTQLGYIDIQYLAPRIQSEVILFAGLMDTITPPSSYFAAYNKITSPKRHIIYPDFGHEGLIGGDDIVWEFFSDL